MLVIKKATLRLDDTTKTLLFRFGEAARPHMRGAMQVVVTVGEAVASEKAPKDRGLLQNSIYGVVEDQWPKVVGVLGSPLVYAAPMEEGTKAFWPPFAPLSEWVQRKFHLSGSSQGVAVFLITRMIQFKIHAHGLKARKFFAAGIKKMQQIAPVAFGQAMANLARQLNDH